MNQQQIPMVAIVPPLDALDEAMFASCTTFQQALGTARALGRRKWSDAALSNELGLQASVWSRIQHKPASSPAYMPEDKLPALCAALGNVGVLQWLAYRCGYRLVPIAETRAQRLRRALADLEAAEAAA
jgi:hypothetical protein